MKIIFMLAVFCFFSSIEPAIAEENMVCALDELRLVNTLGVFFVIIFTLAHTFFYKRRAAKNGQSGLCGITGWLLYFILVNFFSCLLELGTYVSEGVQSLEDALPEEVLGISLAYSADMLVVLASLYGIYMLCRVKRCAVLVNKIVLVAVPLYILVAPCLAMFIAARTILGVELTWDAIKSGYDLPTIVVFIQSLIFSLVWFCYFSVSKRVKCVYGNN